MPAVFLATLAALAALVQGPDTTLSVTRSDRLQVQASSGDITIRTWNRPAIRVASSDEDEPVALDRSGNLVSLRITGPGMNDADYILTVPSWLPVSATSMSGDISIRGVQAEINAETGSGDLAVEGGSGNVSLQSVAGSVTLTGASGHLTANAVNGDVTVKEASGDFTGRSVSGTIELSRVSFSSVEASTVNGDVRYDGPIVDNGRYRFSTHSGDLTVAVPAGANATVSISTFQGDFVSDFPISLQGREGRRFSFTLGNGSARVQLKSFAGDIHLTRPSRSGGR